MSFRPALLALTSILLIPIFVIAQPKSDKREFRAAWVAAVTNLDWPSSGTASVETQKAQMIDMFNTLQVAGFNVIIFHIRTECDALYDSPFEPWSHWLTGQQGRAPSPYYDPLKMAVEEAHKRGMELHAWFNPYRAEQVVGRYATANNHVTKQNPQWVIQSSTLKILDPGLPQVRAHVTKVIADVVTRYDIDGVHMDDYFYPYPEYGFGTKDSASWRVYGYELGWPNTSVGLGDWRRNNVNTLLKTIYDTIQVIKPQVKFGMSPFGIWKNGVPSGITGLDAYSTIYCDGVAWLQGKYIDYITPQLYWVIGGSQDYFKLLTWWGQQRNTRHFYPGQAVYNKTPNEIGNQTRLTRANPDAMGQVAFRAGTITSNREGIFDTLRLGLYKNRALVPIMPWKDSIAPNPPRNLRFERLPNSGVFAMVWDTPLQASDNDTARFYAVYKFNTATPTQQDIDNPANIVTLGGGQSAIPRSGDPATGSVYIAATALDENNNESGLSNIITVNAPQAPVLATPVNGATGLAQGFSYSWNVADQASAYTFQISGQSDFATVLTTVATSDTFRPYYGLLGERTYYWRVNTVNPAGSSVFSQPFSLTTGWPIAPILALPAHASTNIPLQPAFFWMKKDVAQTYQFQITNTSTFDSTTIIHDTTITAPDTSFVYAGPALTPNVIHRWRVRASNNAGVGDWATAFAFRTQTTTSVEQFASVPEAFGLTQNYPNPFNPTTTLRFSLAVPAQTSLKVYDVIGRQIAEIADGYYNAGVYTATFNGSDLPSGMYFAVLQSGSHRAMVRMMLVK